MNKVTVTEISLDELLKKLSELIETKSNKEKQLYPKIHGTYLTRKETAKLLKCSLPTLDEYSKTGLLVSYKVGKRVLFKPNEVEDAISKLATTKFKRGF